MFETRSHSWAQAGLARQLSRAAVKRARIELVLLLPLLGGVLFLYSERKRLFPGLGTEVRVITVIVLLAVGWAVARNVGRVMGPLLFRRVDPSTAGTLGFLIRLITIIAAAVVALRVAGLQPHELALGGAATAVVLGLAAQQTLGNLFAGTVLLSARPFRVGDRIRLQGGPLAGTLEGIVSSLGLLYTVLSDGEEELMVPNTVVLNVAIVPIREPDAVDLRARLRPGLTPATVQRMLEDAIDTPLIDRPRVLLEELDGAEVVVRVQATPVVASDGPKLASEVLDVVGRETRSVAGTRDDGYARETGGDRDRPDESGARADGGGRAERAQSGAGVDGDASVRASSPGTDGDASARASSPGADGERRPRAGDDRYSPAGAARDGRRD